MRKFLFFHLALFLSISLKAQHCAYCGARVSVVHPHANGDTAVINGLVISVLDTFNNPVHQSVWHGNNWQEQAYTMWQNPKSTTFKGLIDNTNPLRPWEVRFWFANNNYVSSYFPQGSCWIVIKDPDGEANGGHFKSKRLHISEIPAYPLCTSFSYWDGPKEQRYFVEHYQALEIELERLE
ncbi:MAG: hypothetical protein NXI09_05700 [Bacteroidetes bacterium]|nr:hypothetical protein [Bacteroidota bacterium]